jgi:hypothetical protein
MRGSYLCLAMLLWISPLASGQSSNPHKDPADFQPPINRGEGIIGKSNDTHELEQPDEQNPSPPGIHVDRV